MSRAENPCTENDFYRVEILARVTSLQILDKEEFSEEEVAEASKLKEELLEEGEAEEPEVGGA